MRRNHRSGQRGEGAKDAGPDSRPDPESCSGTGNPNRGQHAKDEASADIDPERRPGDGIGALGKLQAQAVTQFGSCKAPNGYCEPRLPGRFLCRPHSAVRQGAAFMGRRAVYPERACYFVREIELPAVAGVAVAADPDHQGTAERFPPKDGDVGVELDVF